MPRHRECIVCGDPLTAEQRNKEDVIPIWMQKLLDIRTEPTGSVVRGMPDLDTDNTDMRRLKIKQRREFTVSTFLAPGICGTRCNSGWMSNLEKGMSTSLKPFILGEKKCDQMSPADQDLLARWVMKTAFMFEQNTKPHLPLPIIPVEHVRAYGLRGEPLPGGLALLGYSSTTQGPHFLRASHDWLAHTNPDISVDDANDWIRRIYKATVRFGHLVATVAYLPPDAPYGLLLWPQMHHVLIPPNTHKVYAPPWSLPFPWDHEVALISHDALGLSDGPPDTRLVTTPLGPPLRWYEHLLVRMFRHGPGL